MALNWILKKPLVTEKSTRDLALGRYGFLVDPSADKKQIAAAIEATFGVHVKSVWTTKRPGKTTRVGKTRQLIKKPAQKKAIVALKTGEKIDIFEEKK